MSDLNETPVPYVVIPDETDQDTIDRMKKLFDDHNLNIVYKSESEYRVEYPESWGLLIRDIPEPESGPTKIKVIKKRK